MGKKGDKLTTLSTEATETLLNKIAIIEGVSSKKMFGGHGIFHEKKMFGIVNSKGECYLKINDETKASFIEQDSHQHSKMPYFSIPENIWNNEKELITWAKKSISISKK